jgi:hypothetical protein
MAKRVKKIALLPLPQRKNFAKPIRPPAMVFKEGRQVRTPTITLAASGSSLLDNDGPLTLGKLAPKPKRVKP